MRAIATFEDPKDLWSVSEIHADPQIIREGLTIKYSGSPLDVSGMTRNTHPFAMTDNVHNFARFANNSTFSDIKIKVVDGEESKTYKLHRIVLVAGSLWFEKALEEKFKESGANRMTINADITLFDKLIDILYGRGVPIKGMEGLRVLEMMDYYQVAGPSMKEYIENMSFEVKGVAKFIRELIKYYPPNQWSGYFGGRFVDYLGRIGSKTKIAKILELLPEEMEKGYEYLLESNESMGTESE